MSNSKCFVGSIPIFSALPTEENSRRLALRNRTGLESPWPTSQVWISPSCCHVVNPIGPIWGTISSTPTHKEMVICWDHMGQDEENGGNLPSIELVIQWGYVTNHIMKMISRQMHIAHVEVQRLETVCTTSNGEINVNHKEASYPSNLWIGRRFYGFYHQTMMILILILQKSSWTGNLTKKQGMNPATPGPRRSRKTCLNDYCRFDLIFYNLLMNYQVSMIMSSILLDIYYLYNIVTH